MSKLYYKIKYWLYEVLNIGYTDKQFYADIKKHKDKLDLMIKNDEPTRRFP